MKFELLLEMVETCQHFFVFLRFFSAPLPLRSPAIVTILLHWNGCIQRIGKVTAALPLHTHLNFADVSHGGEIPLDSANAGGTRCF
jgi:hypothetical protein